jgi:hypothetical protein
MYQFAGVQFHPFCLFLPIDPTRTPTVAQSRLITMRVANFSVYGDRKLALRKREKQCCKCGVDG